MLAYTHYESDNRVRRYAESLASRGDRVDVIALGGGGVPLGIGEICGVNVHRVQERESTERHKWNYAFRLARFLWVSSLILARRHRRIRYDVVHVHNIPDFLVFAAWYPKWTGAKVILDIHDIVPELFASKFSAKPNSLYVRLLRGIERAATAFADHVIVSNHLWQEKLTSRSIAKEKCSVFLNHVDTTIFYRRRRTRSDDKFIILFPGSLQWHQGLDIAIKAFARVKAQMSNAEFHLYVSGGGGGADATADLALLAERLGISRSIIFHRGVSLDEIADVMANADLGVIPKRADSFGNEAYSTKIMEFMSQGIPVVVSRTKVDSYYFNERVVRFFASGNEHALADAILDVIQNTALRESLIAGGYEYVNQHSWDRKRDDYFELVDRLSRKTHYDSVTAGSPGAKCLRDASADVSGNQPFD